MTTTEETTAEEEAAAVDADEVCGSCGVAAIDDVQNNHREEHEEECKKRMAELRDKQLFEWPDESYLGECPICCLPLPLDRSKSGLRNVFMTCCSKRICEGCHYTNSKREYEAGLQERCLFCREPASKSQEESHKLCMNRIKKHNDPAAMNEMGKRRREEGDYGTALEYFTKAAEMGDADAHYSLSIMYHEGHVVENDKEKEVYHLEEAAIAGHPNARYNLGCNEGNNGRFERAKKHFIIAANLGYHDSLSNLRLLYAEGHASKEDYADALRAYQAAVEATKSAERKKAEAYYYIEMQ